MGIRTEGTSHFKGMLWILFRVLYNLAHNPVRKMLATQLVRVTDSLANPQTQVLSITTRYIKFASDLHVINFIVRYTHLKCITSQWVGGREAIAWKGWRAQKGVCFWGQAARWLSLCTCARWEQNVTTCVWMWRADPRSWELIWRGIYHSGSLPTKCSSVHGFQGTCL